jgi:hypothetical protein
MEDGPRAVLIIGVYGSGKSSVGAEIAEILERRRTPYALLDLDYLAWFDTGERVSSDDVFAANLRAVLGNYLTVGVRTFILAGSINERAELDDLKSELLMPVTVVRLELPIEEIERRLLTDVTSGRKDDLRVAREWVASGAGTGMEDLTVSNDRPIREVALDIINRLGWG